MKAKFLNALLIVTSLFGYLEWSGDSHMFLFQAEVEVISRMFTDIHSMIHPFTLIPMLGQLLLIITLFRKNPGKILTTMGMLCLLILLGFMFVIGLLGLNYKIALSTLPFLVVVVFTVNHYRRIKRAHAMKY
jgi:hypothetical protein